MANPVPMKLTSRQIDMAIKTIGDFLGILSILAFDSSKRALELSEPLTPGIYPNQVIDQDVLLKEFRRTIQDADVMLKEVGY